MPLTLKEGDMFKERADAIVNTVNCVGVMGKGVALEFKRRWPENFKAYKRLCDAKKLRPGCVFVHENIDMHAPRDWHFLVNFPTKDHWRQKSKMEFIEAGLDDFVHKLRENGIRSVVMPPLGCGNGGLDWGEVKDLLDVKLSPITDIDFVVFAPGEPKQTARPRTKMTFPRALLLKALGDLSILFDGRFTRIVLQKIVYFFQEMGVDYKVAFARNEYGPYSDELRDAFVKMEEQGLIEGFTSEDRETKVTDAGYSLANEFLTDGDREHADDLIKRVSLLIEGYESPLGMELLSSVHFLATHEDKRSLDGVVQAVTEWSDRKRAFNPSTVETAYRRLTEDKLMPSF